MTKEQFELFLQQSILAKGKSLEKVKKFFKEPNEKKLKIRLYKLLQSI